MFDPNLGTKQNLVLMAAALRELTARVDALEAANAKPSKTAPPKAPKAD